MDETPTPLHRLETKVDPETLIELDTWRIQHGHRTTRAQALRWLVGVGLNVETGREPVPVAPSPPAEEQSQRLETVVTAFRATPETLAAVDRLVQAEGSSRSEIFREAVDDLLRRRAGAEVPA